MTLFGGNLPQKWQREREREKTQNNRREREREERERERAQASWIPNDMVTAGNRAPQVEFPSSALPILWMCTTVFAWFTPSLMDCRVWSQVIAFGGALSLYNVLCTSLTKNSCNTKMVFNHFDRDSHTYIYIIIYIYISCTCIYHGIVGGGLVGGGLSLSFKL